DTSGGEAALVGERPVTSQFDRWSSARTEREIDRRRKRLESERAREELGELIVLAESRVDLDHDGLRAASAQFDREAARVQSTRLDRGTRNAFDRVELGPRPIGGQSIALDVEARRCGDGLV